MKQTLAILLALVALAAFGQEATVKRVELTNSIAASKYPMTDLNGRTAALVIVQVIADNVEFTGSVLNGGVVRKTGEYWVYMGVGAKELHIHSDKFLPVEIRFPDYGIPRLESAATYAVTLSLPQPAAQPQSASAGYNYLVLNVSPANAQVTIDGKPVDVQSGVAKRLLRSGATYSYRVEAQGYMPEEGTVTLGSERMDRNIALRSTKGKLSVATTTPGTEIYVNGDRMGADSWTGELSPDNYLVEGRLASHRNTDMMVSITTGETSSVTLPALAPVTGSLNVDYTPAGATVTIDGTARGITPNVFDGLLVGPHTVTISADGHQAATLTATIAESSLTSLEGALNPAPDEEEVNYKPFLSNGKYGFKDENEKIIIPAMYDNAWPFSEGLANVKNNGKWGFIDKSNKFVIPAMYDDAWYFSEDLAPVETNGKWGFINKNNEFVIPATFELAFEFSEDLAPVETDGKWGFIDKNNSFVIPAIYDFAYTFAEGLSLVKTNWKWGYIDNNNKFVIPAIYNDAKPFSEGLAPVSINGKWGYIDKHNKLVIPAIYNPAYKFSNGKAKVQLNGRVLYIDNTGKEVK